MVYSLMGVIKCVSNFIIISPSSRTIWRRGCITLKIYSTWNFSLQHHHITLILHFTPVFPHVEVRISTFRTLPSGHQIQDITLATYSFVIRHSLVLHKIIENFGKTSDILDSVFSFVLWTNTLTSLYFKLFFQNVYFDS